MEIEALVLEWNAFVQSACQYADYQYLDRFKHWLKEMEHPQRRNLFFTVL